jgi:hypothetical protein
MRPFARFSGFARLPTFGRTSALPLLVWAACLTGCATAPAGPPTALQLPIQTAWYEGRVVHYVTTDVSDRDLARAKGVNFVPRLKDLLPESPTADHRRGSPLERVYAFVNTQQPTVFPSVPRPVGPESVDLGYTPLWRMVQVNWQPGRKIIELKSEEAILQAEEQGEVKLKMTDFVLNCPVVWVQGDAPLRGVRLVSEPAGQ